MYMTDLSYIWPLTKELSHFQVNTNVYPLQKQNNYFASRPHQKNKHFLQTPLPLTCLFNACTLPKLNSLIKLK